MSFEDYASEFGSTCKKCNGKRVFFENDKTLLCFCQLKASIKFKYDSMPIENVVKKLDWDDYLGDTFIENQKIKIHGWQDARDKALGYCFSSYPISRVHQAKYTADSIKECMKSRISLSKIPNRLREGANLVILGEDATGKTFLASLIAKEIIYASVLLKDMYVKWISFSKLISSLCFNRIDYDLVDDLSFANDFLILDHVHRPAQGNYQKNILDEIFSERIANNRPTIITGSYGLDEYDETMLRDIFSDGFFRLLNHNLTAKIKVKRL